MIELDLDSPQGVPIASHAPGTIPRRLRASASEIARHAGALPADLAKTLRDAALAVERVAADPRADVAPVGRQPRRGPTPELLAVRSRT